MLVEDKLNYHSSIMPDKAEDVDHSGQYFPFAVVVVTFPDEGAARVASEGPLLDLQQLHPNTRFLATCDPMGCRCGSGGGTLAALAEVGDGGDGGSILILHAGGDSSRCFTQMALGKAWTNLPLVHPDDRRQSWSNPILLGMDSIARIFSQAHCLPTGSIVVAASDALLSIPRYQTQFDRQDSRELGTSPRHGHEGPIPDVLGVAFPAPWETAKNHGVYVLSSDSIHPVEGDASEASREIEVPIRQVLQKPSLETLQQQPFATLGVIEEQHAQGMAWIDNGIIAFLPRAAQALHQLANGILHTSTKEGLLKAHEEQKAHNPSVTYQEVTHKVDLYTHFLQALTIAGTNEDGHREDYLKNHAADLDPTVANAIFDALSPFSFQALAIPRGKFLHLGTTRELIDFYVHGCRRSTTGHEADLSSRHALYTQNCAYFGSELGMIPRMQVYCEWKRDSDNATQPPRIAQDTVILASILEGTTSSSIGEGTVIEFCSLLDNNTPLCLQLGKNCLLSSLRNLKCTESDAILRIPDNTCMQMMPLLPDSEKKTGFVVMALGVNDPIKNSIQESTLFGIPMTTFMDWAGLTREDLWDSDASATIWNAKLHPVIMDEDSSVVTLWDWVNHVPKGDDTTPPPASLLKWKKQRRLSLSQVRDQSDAASEFCYRHDLVHKIIPLRHAQHCDRITQILIERRHDECDFYPLVTDMLGTGLDFVSPQGLQALHTLDNVISNALLDRSQYDVCGRALMVQSALLDDLAEAMRSIDDCGTLPEIQGQCSELLKTIQSRSSSPPDRQKAFNEIASRRDHHIIGNGGRHLKRRLVFFSELMEAMARVMTEICVSGFHPNNNALGTAPSKLLPVFNQWVIATAPARVDLAGGWSDTPPICYEFGSRVTGMAVTVDGKKPLSCRCRIVLAAEHSQELGIIHVRSELRESKTCALTSFLDLHMSSLDDMRQARDPTADGALIKCALVCLGLVTLDVIQLEGLNNNLQEYVDRFCQSPDGLHARMEIVVTSLLPQGSGMGTSSILGGCVLAAVARCVGLELGEGTEIIDSVSVLEQILSTGGGFQDQVNGLIGGVKTVSSKEGELPIKLSIERATLDDCFQKELNDNLLLAFTGKTRLARNILQSVLRRFARRTPEVVACMQGLVDGAQKVRDAITNGDLETVGQCLQTYYEQKKHMAGEESGVEPPVVRLLIEDLSREKLIIGASLCGAGGGGFLVIIATPGADKSKIHSIVKGRLNQCNDDTHGDFSWHNCHLSEEGLTTSILPTDGSVDEFVASWHS